jgi:hypothetical protein
VAFEVTCSGDALRVELTGLDRFLTWRRSLVVELAAVRSVVVKDRGVLETDIDHRVAGIGTHNGGKRAGRRRVGVMLGRSVAGRQFWAVRSGVPTTRLLVLDLEAAQFARVVLEAGADVEACVTGAVATR